MEFDITFRKGVKYTLVDITIEGFNKEIICDRNELLDILTLLDGVREDLKCVLEDQSNAKLYQKTISCTSIFIPICCVVDTSCTYIYCFIVLPFWVTAISLLVMIEVNNILTTYWKKTHG